MKNTLTSSKIKGNLSINTAIFLSKDQTHSSLERSDIKGVDILLHIPCKICSLLITIVNLSITLIEDKITAGLI